MFGLIAIVPRPSLQALITHAAIKKSIRLYPQLTRTFIHIWISIRNYCYFNRIFYIDISDLYPCGKTKTTNNKKLIHEGRNYINI